MSHGVCRAVGRIMRSGGGNGIIRNLLEEDGEMADCSRIRKFRDAADYRANFVVQPEIDK